MNGCKQLNTEKLTDYLLNNLDRKETDQVQLHLMNCEYCRHKLAGMRALTKEIHEPAIEQVKRSWLLSLMKVAVAAGVLLLVALGGLLYFLTPSEGGYDPVSIEKAPQYHDQDGELAPVDSMQNVIEIHEELIEPED